MGSGMDFVMVNTPWWRGFRVAIVGDHRQMFKAFRSPTLSRLTRQTIPRASPWKNKSGFIGESPVDISWFA